MRKIILIVSAVLAFVLISPVSVYAVSFGSFSCGEIVQFDRDNNQNQMGGISLWMAGFITASTMNQKGRFPDSNAATLYLLLVKHCRENPNSNSISGTHQIYLEQRLPK